MWAYLVRYPGLVVLHDGQLHHARGRQLMRQRRYEDYRSEFQFSHPATDGAVAELGIAGLLGRLTYLWPMRRLVVDAARLVIVHNQWLAEQIRGEQPDAQVELVEMGVPASVADPGARARIRQRHRIPPDAMVFLGLGGVTPEKRIGPALKALAAIARTVPEARLLLVGDAVEHCNPEADARALGVADRVTVAGFVPDAEVPDYLAAADVCLCMRWPSSRETSAAWLRCLAGGQPTIITDLVHTVDIPAYDPRSWTLLYAPRESDEPGAASEPACVSVDILDEDHSLSLAMRRLATDPRLRSSLGRQARELWAERFTLLQMVGRYREVITAALDAPGPSPTRRARWPDHLLVDGTQHAVQVLRELGLPESRIAELWRSTP
jgi:glycosyltransferase involved in cell wall biosynthesis